MKRYFLKALFLLAIFSGEIRAADELEFDSRVEFDTVTIGESRDLTVSIKNVSGFAQNLKNFTLDPDGPFIYIGSALKRLPPDSIFIFTIRYEPNAAGMHNDELTWTTDQSGKTFTIFLTGVGITTNPLETEISLPQILAKTGDTVSITARVSDMTALRREIQTQSIDGYRMRIRFKKSIATPVSKPRDSTIGNYRIVERTGVIDQNSLNEIVAEIPLITALGDTSATPIICEEFAWTSGGVFKSSAKVNNGLLTLTDIDSVNGAPRFLNTNAGVLKLGISPNPLTTESTISAGFENDGEISIYSVLGEEVLKTPAQNSLKITRAQFLKSGIYYCRLRSGEFSLTRILRVE